MHAPIRICLPGIQNSANSICLLILCLLLTYTNLKQLKICCIKLFYTGIHCVLCAVYCGLNAISNHYFCINDLC